MPDGQVVFEITGDNRPIENVLRDTTHAIERESRNWDQAANESANNIQGAFTRALDINRIKGWALKAGKAMIDFGMDAIAAASDLAEVQNVVDVTFGSSAGEIDAWAKNAISQFGLTETQAKKFASTMGAMMKSSGLAGREIVGMSEDLAGLAADMASFYNMDFETAFAKIRSGISGETEPLKQLGINMSVANLEAFALTQGITKAFDKMSQGEQVLLRYQYLMQATADAQGDFARTTDGYANGLRLLQNNLNQLQTNVGSLLLQVVSPTVSGLNELFNILNRPAQTTVLDDFARIEEETNRKLAEIKATATEATALIETLGTLSTTEPGKVMEAIAKGANVLDASAPGTWRELLTAIKESTGMGDAIGDISGLSDALAGTSESLTKGESFSQLIAALSANAGSLSELAGTDEATTRDWLKGLAESANTLDEGKADAWNQLLGQLVGGLPGLAETDAGKKFFDTMALNFLAMGNESETAKNGLLAMGWSSEKIKDQQQKWLDVMQRLIKTIPGLSSVINAETGEVKGGSEALRQYLKDWQQYNEDLVRLQAIQAKREALLESTEKQRQAQLEVDITKQRIKAITEALDAIAKEESELWGGPLSADENSAEYKAAAARWLELRDEYYKLSDELGNPPDTIGGGQKGTGLYLTLAEQTEALEKESAAAKEANEQLDALDAIEQELKDRTEESTFAVEENAETIAGWSEDVQKSAGEVYNALADATDELATYMEKVREETARQVEQAINGFDRLKTAEQRWKEAQDELSDLQTQLEKARAEGAETGDIHIRITGAQEAMATINNMTASLKSQIDYINEYMANLSMAQELGLDSELLAQLSDGSQESAMYLHAIANASEGEVADLNEQYALLITRKKEFTDTLAANKLAVDSEFQGLVDKTNGLIAQLSQYDQASEAMGNTVQGIADGIAAHIPDVELQVDKLAAALSRLNWLNIGGFGFSGGVMRMFAGAKNFLLGSHANGMDYVPRDGWAFVHGGERIQTAAEAELYRRYGNQAPGADYGAMGGAIRDGMGNLQIVWHGRVVADVLSEQQGNSYRALERSGWKP